MSDDCQHFLLQGANSHGQLGLGYQSEMCETPQRVPPPTQRLNWSSIQKMHGGGTHLFILDDAGTLHASGCNNKGQLGIGSKESKATITTVSAANVFADVACGWDSTAAIDVHGLAFVWGSNAFGQLGYNSRSSPCFIQPTPLQLPANEKATKIAFGLRHMCVLCAGGTVYIAGKWKDSQNFDAIAHNETVFYRLKMEPTIEIARISSGSAHVLCATERSVHGFGDNKFGQCAPVAVSPNERVKHIRSGWTHNGLQTDAGKVFLWGRNTYGQLANGGADKSQEMVPLTGIGDGLVDFHLGAEHGLAVTVNGHVYTWGWNEHANCGNGNVDNVYVYPLCELGPMQMYCLC